MDLAQGHRYVFSDPAARPWTTGDVRDSRVYAISIINEGHEYQCTSANLSEPHIPQNSFVMTPVLRNYYLNLSSNLFSSLISYHLKNIYSLFTTVAVCNVSFPTVMEGGLGITCNLFLHPGMSNQVMMRVEWQP